MSTKHEYTDSRTWQTSPQNSVKCGLLRILDRDGGNYTPGESSGAPHPYSYHLSETFDTPFKWGSTTNPNMWFYSSPLAVGFESPIWTSEDQLKLINKLGAKHDNTSFDAGIAGSELGRATDMLAGRVKQLATAAKQARRGNLKGVADALGAGAGKVSNNRRKISSRDQAKNNQKLSDAQLEFQYGIKPLVDDIWSLAGTIDGFTRKRTRRVRVSRRKNGKVVINQFFPGTGTIFMSRSIVAFLEQEEPTLPERLGLVNPAGIAWNAMPWSFVIDWVIPIGDWIEAQSFALRARGTFVTTTFEYRSASGSGTTSIVGPGQWIDGGCQWFVRDVSVSRTISNSIDVPLPGLKSSLFGGKPLTRLGNALALAANALTKGK